MMVEMVLGTIVGMIPMGGVVSLLVAVDNNSVVD